MRVSALAVALALAVTAAAHGRSPNAASLAAQRHAVWRVIYPEWKPNEPVGAYARSVDEKIAKLELRPVAGADKALSGASAKLVVEADGQRYVAKLRDTKYLKLEREQFAHALRRAADEPTVSIAPQTVKLPSGDLHVYVKPFIPASGQLPANPRLWSPAERNTILAEHAWAEFLGNYDTKNEQSLVLDLPGGKKALNIDWDLALTDYEKNGPISRFKHFSPEHHLPFAPPAHALLYRDFVHGKIDLDFAPTFDAISRIEKLSDQQIRDALAPFLAHAFAEPGAHVGPYRDPESLVKAVIGRRDGLRASFEKFVGVDPANRDPRSLLGERDALMRTHGLSELAHPRSLVRDGYDIALGKLGETRFVPAVLRLYRKVHRE